MILNLIRKTLADTARTMRRNKAKSLVQPLCVHSDPKVRQLGSAISETLAGNLSPEERALLEPIERRRAQLKAVPDQIEMLDFGAGDHDSTRTRQEMDKGVIKHASIAKITMASKSAFWATLLHKLVRHTRPDSCVELGTCVGVSAAYQAAAMKLNGGGRLVTLEGAPSIADLAAETFKQLEIENVNLVTGPFQKTLEEVLRQAAPVDYFFNDGHHDHDAVLEYLERSLPYLADRAIVVFDDISWSPGMQRAWKQIEAHPRVSISVDLRMIGIAVVDQQPPAERLNFRVPL